MKKFLMLVFIMVLSLGLIACGTDNDGDPVDEDPIVENEDNEDEIEDNEGEDVDQDEEDPDVDGNEDIVTEPETNRETVTLYFVSDNYVVTGDESGDIILTEEREVQYEDNSLEEAIVRELMAGPEDTATMDTLIPAGITLLGVTVEDGTAFVDFASEGLSGGSMEETYTIEQIVDTLTGLDNVDRVQFLIDGEEAETLMGHFEILEPFEGE